MSLQTERIVERFPDREPFMEYGYQCARRGRDGLTGTARLLHAMARARQRYGLMLTPLNVLQIEEAYQEGWFKHVFGNVFEGQFGWWPDRLTVWMAFNDDGQLMTFIPYGRSGVVRTVRGQRGGELVIPWRKGEGKFDNGNRYRYGYGSTAEYDVAYQ